MTGAQWKIAMWAFAIALAIFATGVVMAARLFPEARYDWMYQVVSALASRKTNPEGGRWFSTALGLSMLALWPAVSWLRATTGDRRWPILAFRAGMLFGVAVGIERLTFLRFSSWVHNGHEALAVGTFAGLYAGLLGLYGQRLRHGRAGSLIVAAPLAAIIISQVVLYFDQRDLGWVDRDWRAMGVSVFLSFAFWQWLAIAFLWIGLGHLLWTSRIDDFTRPARSALSGTRGTPAPSAADAAASRTPR